MKVVNIQEIKAKFSSYANLAASGESIVVAKRNKPIAVLSPYSDETSHTTLVFGVMKDAFIVPEEFDEPLDEFEMDFYAQ